MGLRGSDVSAVCAVVWSERSLLVWLLSSTSIFIVVAITADCSGGVDEHAMSYSETWVESGSERYQWRVGSSRCCVACAIG